MVRALLCALVLFYFQRFAHGARIRSTGHQGSMGRMGYLTRDEASGGTLYFQWAEEGSETGALASVVPGPNVKKWELNAKKKEIARGVRNDADWFQGWVEFLSLARKKGTTVTLLQKEIQIVLLYPNDEVSIVEVDKGFNIQESQLSKRGVLNRGDVRRRTSSYVDVRRRTSMYVDVRYRTSMYVDVCRRRRTRTYVDIRRRRHTSINVRRRTTTYVDVH